MRFSESTKYLNKAVDVQDDYSDAYYLLGRIYDIKENKEQAQFNYEKTIDICPMHSP